MKHTSKTILSVIICVCIKGVQAQTYQVAVSNEPFVFLENPESAVDVAWNLPEFQLPLGFDFNFFDITTDHLYSIPNSEGGDFELNQDKDHIYQVFPFFASLIDRGAQQDSALSPINYKTQGLAGQRVFTLEFIEAGLFDGLETDDGVFLDYISFQLRLHEGSGNIEYHIGPYSIQEDPELVFDSNPCSVSGPIIGLLADAESWVGGQIGELILLAGDPVNPTIVTDEIVCLNWPIPENTVYRFSRMGTAVGENLRFAKQPMLFPNPTFGDISLRENNANKVIYPVIVMDALGKQVVLWNTESEISAAGLSAGCYYVVVTTKSKVFTEKLIVLSE